MNFVSLFDQKSKPPLADRMRPRNMDEFIGQAAIVGAGRYLKRMMEKDSVPSLIFYGPPGTGKTTLAKVIANMTGGVFEQVNAVAAGAADLRKVIAAARERKTAAGVKTILFIDEIHRFNKAQQDILLPCVENGVITLIGATTENPFFEVNSPLLSRMKIIRLEPLTEEDVNTIVLNALSDRERGYGAEGLTAEEEAIAMLAQSSGGDARTALNLLEQAVELLPVGAKRVGKNEVREVLAEAGRRYDKKGDEHYDVVSAFIKSMRGSSPNAALHYLARMIEGGEDLKFIARRIVICAAEDVGNADPQAIVVAMAAAQAAQFVGFPEASIPLAQAVTYIATAPKSNSSCLGIDYAARDVREKNCGRVPPHLRSTAYRGAALLGNGRDYQYPHDYEGNFVEQQYLPDGLLGSEYYKPGSNGYEKVIRKQMEAHQNRLDKRKPPLS
jgi:putative ATPase